MTYSKSSVLSTALACAFLAVEFSAVANAQNSGQDFPWRAKSTAKTIAKPVKSSFATPTRDLTTIETIATPTPSFESMPSVIYDQGKKYVRQGDTYVESPNVAAAAVVRKNYTPQVPAVKKSSWLQKSKDLTGRLNPFSKSMRSPTAYRSSDWKVPSFSQSLSSFSKKNDDPITFAAITPLPAKTSVPSSLDSIEPMLASNETYKTPYQAPAISLPARDSQFSSALPTETKITSVASGSVKKITQEFSPVIEVMPEVGRQVSVFESTPPQTSRTASLSADSQFWSPRR